MDTSFYSLNWQANIHQLCPSFSTVLINTYRSDVNLYIGYETLLSEEGTTQGDSLAMPMYALGTVPLINVLSDDHIKQVWCADDALLVEVCWTFVAGGIDLFQLVLILAISKCFEDLFDCERFLL